MAVLYNFNDSNNVIRCGLGEIFEYDLAVIDHWLLFVEVEKKRTLVLVDGYTEFSRARW